MKKYIIKIIFFSLSIFLVYIFLNIYIYHSKNTYHSKKEIADINLNDTEILILGNSHSLFGVDPVYFNKKAINLSNISQSLYYDILLTEYYINKMPELKVIAINLSFFSFNYQLDFSPNKWRRNLYYYYWKFKPTEIDIGFYKDMINIPSIIFKNGLLNSNTIDSTGFQKMEGIIVFEKNVNALEKRIKLYETLFNNGTSCKNLFMLKSLIETANKKNVKLVFFETPKHPIYLQRLDQDIITKFNAHIKEINVIGNILFFDQKDIVEFTNDDFRDFDHLNYNEAKKFSLMLSKFIDENDFK